MPDDECVDVFGFDGADDDLQTRRADALQSRTAVSRQGILARIHDAIPRELNAPRAGVESSLIACRIGSPENETRMSENRVRA